MTNAEKFLKDGVKEEFIKEINAELDISFDQFNVEEWLNTPCKPQLTEDERTILRNIPKEYIKIRRNDWQEIEFVQEDCKYRTCYLLSHLFKFIKARRKI